MDLPFYDRLGRPRQKPPDAPIIPRTSVYALITNETSVLLVQSSGSGLYELPGGGVDDAETHDEALAREVMEETGLTITPPFTALGTRYQRFYADDLDAYYDSSLHFYRVRASNPNQTLRAQDASEIQLIDWVPFKELEVLPFRTDHRHMILGVINEA